MSKLLQIMAVFTKDARIELRTRFGINVVSAFVAASLFLILFTLRAEQLNPTPKSGLVWIIILFGSLSALGRSFITETDKHTYDLLRVYGTGYTVYAGKLLYNAAFTFIINAFTFIAYTFLLNMQVVSWSAFLTLLVLGTAGISGVATMTAAIVSQADRKGAVFSVLSLPLFMPLILLLTRITKSAFVDANPFLNEAAALFGFAGTTITAGIILFDFIWED